MGIPPRLASTAERVLTTFLSPFRTFSSLAAPVWTPPTRQPWGKGTGRASYAVVRRRRVANKAARASRRINRRTR